MDSSKIIGKNIKEFRVQLGLSQNQVSDFIGVDRSLIAHYESGKREIPLIQLEKLCDLFATDIENLLEEDAVNQKTNLAFAFRTNGANQTYLENLASFQKVVKNYIKMHSISNGLK